MRALLILSSLFIIFGSLYPFDVDLALWSTRSMARFDDHVGAADIIANVALFIPYGFAARSLPRRWLYAILGFVIALGVQIVQDVIPDRSPSLWDVVINMAGLAVGWVMAMALHGRTLAPRLPVSLFLPAVCFVAYELAPFAPTLDIGLLRAHLKLFVDAPVVAGDIVRNLAQGLIVAVLLALALPVATVRKLLALLLPLLAAARLVIVDNGVSPGAIAGLLAAALLAAVLPLRAQALRLAAVAAALALLLWDGLTPFEIRAAPLMPQLFPFAGLFSGDWLGNLVSVTWKVFLYGSMIEIGRRDIGRGGAVLAVVSALLVEGAQIVLASGVPEITDVVIAAALAWLLPQLESSSRHIAEPPRRKFKVRPGRSYR